MKVSVITVVHNGAETIRDCIDSVLSQTAVDIEYIIVDGVSNDNTLDIVRSYGEKIHTIISEPDTGIYDAMNKGIILATGEIVAILNSDDMYADNQVIEKIVHEFEKNLDIGCVYGNLEYVDRNDTTDVRRIWKSRSYARDLFRTGWHPPHPSFFVRKNIYDTYGLYRTDLKIASDYEMMLRLLEVKNVSSSHISGILVKMRTGGMSNKTLWGIIKANIETLKAWKLNGLPVPYLVFFKKPLSKLWQIRKIRNIN